jgi:ATP-binding cassette, subfamily B, multidrug efflux pump
VRFLASLPTLNADIIDNGVGRGDTDYIIRTGAVMLPVSLVQVLCTIAAVYFGARTAMQFGRDLRSSIFRRVSEFSSSPTGCRPFATPT